MYFSWSQTTQSILKMQNNLLRGQIPSFSSNGQLSRVDLSKNRLSGMFPEFFSHKPVGLNGNFLRYVDLSQNQISLPSPLSVSLPTVSLLNISRNDFSGTVNGIFLNQYGSIVDTTGNLFDCPLPWNNRVKTVVNLGDMVFYFFLLSLLIINVYHLLQHNRLDLF